MLKQTPPARILHGDKRYDSNIRRPGLAEERRSRYVDAISDTVDRASRLTGQLLAFAWRPPLKREIFGAAGRVSAIADMLNTVVGSRIRIETELGSQACFVETDASRFENVLVNMAVNARDAMQEEGALAIRAWNTAGLPSISGKAGPAGDHVAVSIADTGHGMSRRRPGEFGGPAKAASSSANEKGPSRSTWRAFLLPKFMQEPGSAGAGPSSGFSR